VLTWLLQVPFAIALMLGNSRLHWGWLQDGKLMKTWETSHLKTAVTEQQFPTHLFPPEIARCSAGAGAERRSRPEWVYLASVVPQQTQLWETYPYKTIITRETIPLTNLYSTLGIDRALCAYGAGETYGYPVLVVDGGTALTYTAVGQQRNFLGGAILPGLSLQLRALGQQTAALPETSLPDALPELWATATESAIASGIVHTTLAGVYNYLTAWRKKFSDGKVVLTGGDALSLHSYLKQKYPHLSQRIILDQAIIFRGISALLE